MKQFLFRFRSSGKFAVMILVISISITALLTGIARAADPPKIQDTYVIDGVTYYNVNSSNIDVPEKFYEDAFNKAHSSLGGLSLAKLWMLMAVGEAAASGGFHYIDGLSVNPNKKYISAAKEGLLKGSTRAIIEPTTVSMSYSAAKWNKNTKSLMATYRLSTPLYYVEFGINFKNFNVVALIPDDSKHYVSTVVDNAPPKTQLQPDTELRNSDAKSFTASKKLEKSETHGFSTTIEHSESYTFTEGIKFGATFGVEILGVNSELSTELSTEFAQSFTDGWSKQTTDEKTITGGTDVTVEVPPYTVGMIKMNETDTTTTAKYNCPIGLLYTVEIDCHATLGNGKSYSFGASNSNAMSDINYRAFKQGNKNYDKDSIDWQTILKDSDFKDAIQKLAARTPASATGATTKYHSKNAVQVRIDKFVPLYPLKYIALGNDETEKTLSVGNYFRTRILTLKGYNSQNGAYYDFQPYGRWAVVDANSKELPASSAPVVIEKDSVSNETMCRAKRPGVCYLKFLIDEKSYPKSTTDSNSNEYIKNSDLSSTAAVKITVLDDSKSDEDLPEQLVTFEIEGDYNGIVNSVPEKIEQDADGYLSVYVYDKTGKEIDARSGIDYVWASRNKKGIKIEDDGTVSFTQPGTHKVRVESPKGTYYSKWKEIVAEVLGDDEDLPEEKITPTEYADSDTFFDITGSYIGGVSYDAENIEGAGKLQVQFLDKKTDKVKYVIYSWEADSNNPEGMTLNEDGMVSFTKPGLYKARVKSAEFYSNWVLITADDKAPARFTVLPVANEYNTYTGTSKDLVYGGRYEHGSRVMYGLGSETESPKEYTSDIPQAVEIGTYYVWCYVAGDTTYKNSEPICITAQIHDPNDWTNQDQDQEQSSDHQGQQEHEAFLGSSSGTCNISFGFLGMIVLGGLLLRNRRESR